MERFGKSIVPLLRHKQDYFERNDVLLANSRRITATYAEQPERERCKNCRARSRDSAPLAKNGIGYWLCASCGHLNGAYEESAAFAVQMYTGHGAANYATNYTVADREAFHRRRIPSHPAATW